MALRYALLLIGLIVVAVVVFHTFDLARLRRRGRDDAARDPAEVPPPRLEPVAGLDFDPPLDSVTGKRSLAADAPVDVSTGAPRNTLAEELETLEEVATMPLNLDSGLRNKPRHADLGRPALPDD